MVQNKTITASPRIQPKAADFYKSNFKSLNAGAEWAIDAMFRLSQTELIKDTVRSDRGPFEIKEAFVWAGEALPRMVRHTLAYELRGKFTKGELSMIVDVLNGHGMTMRMSPMTPGQHIGLSVSDSFELYPGAYEEKWGVDKAHMVEALSGLTSFQLAALEYWAAMFWEGDFNAENALEKHCAVLSAEEV